VQSIAAEAVQKMVALGADPKNILAAIGPSIGPCHFEVGPEVQEEFTRRFGEALPYRPSAREGHSMVDLWEANRQVLLEAGLEKDRIFTAKVCTFCNNLDYYSHRYTNGRRGSLIAAIAMEGIK
jgi:copper oxidase (laccase) domain-containing protein